MKTMPRDEMLRQSKEKMISLRQQPDPFSEEAAALFKRDLMLLTDEELRFFVE